MNCLIKSVPSANYEETVDTNLNLENSPTLILGSVQSCSSSSATQQKEDSSSSGSEEISSEGESASSNDGKENLEKCAIKYYTGYLANKTLKKFDCNNCKSKLLSKNIFFTDKNEILMFHKLYKNIIKTSEVQRLMALSVILYKVVKKRLLFLTFFFSKFCYRKNVCSLIFKKLSKKININKLTKSLNNCKEHT